MGGFKLTNDEGAQGECPVGLLRLLAIPEAGVTHILATLAVERLRNLSNAIVEMLADKTITTCSGTIQAYVRKDIEAKEIVKAFYVRDLDDMAALHTKQYRAITPEHQHNVVGLYLLKLTHERLEVWTNTLHELMERENAIFNQPLQPKTVMAEEGEIRTSKFSRPLKPRA